MINERTRVFSRYLPALIYYWLLRIRGFRAKKPREFSGGNWNNYWLVECD